MRVEDGIIPMLLESLILTHIKQKPNQKEHFTKALEMVQNDIRKEINGSTGAIKRLLKLDRKITSHFVDNKWDTRKCFMIVSHIAAALTDAEALLLNNNTTEVLKDLNKIVIDAYNDPEIGCDITKTDESAAKQAPKIIKLMQQEGYF